MKKNYVTALLLTLFTTIAQAALVDLADIPLTNETSATVRPNIMLVFDNSGSMAWEYTPDYIVGNSMCLDSGDDRSGGGSDTTNGADSCIYGDPPYMSPDTNFQYYNPDFRYLPAIDYQGNLKTNMNAANTSNWTQVPTDAFNIISNSIYGTPANGKVNLAQEYKDRIWCDNPSATDDSYTTKEHCRANEINVTYPEVIGSKLTTVYPYGKNNNWTPNTRYRESYNPDNPNDPYSGPYYYRLVPTEYCNNPDLRDCKPMTSPGTGADAAYVYPATVRFCTTSALTTCQAKYQDATPTYKYPKYVGNYVAAVAATSGTAAKATLQVASFSGTGSVDIPSFIINDYEFGPLATASTNTTTIAESIRDLINSQSGTTHFSATSSTNTVTISSTTIADGADWNGKTISVTTAPQVAVLPIYSLRVDTVSGTSNMSVLKAGSKINNVDLFTSDLLVNKYTSGGNNSTNRLNFCTQMRNKIDTAQYTLVTACTLDGSGRAIFTFKPNEDLLTATAASVTAWNVNPTIASTNVSITKARPTNMSLKSMTFKINGSTAGYSVSGITSSGLNAIAAALPGRINAGVWQKTFISPGVNSYPKSVNRDDCMGDTCTYEEEMTNFANWFAYYHTRNQSMKVAVGKSFSMLNDNYRVGLINLTTAPATGASSFMAVAPFTPNSTNRSTWYNKLYNINASSNTPLREAMYTVGNYYKGDYGSVPDPIEYSCQQNYAFLATDGYWNGTSGWNLVGNTDNTDTGYSKRIDGAYDGALPQTESTLADVTMYFYKNDLRPTGSKSTNNVPVTTKDTNNAQHMVTFTMGLGVDGLMTYRKDYAEANTGDFYKIANGTTGCTWESSLTTTCNWPEPVSGQQTSVDDLWHAAVNGRGKYYSAKSPQDAAEGLTDALLEISQTTGASAASATSSPNITPTDNSIFSSTYETVVWSGEVMKQRIDPSTGSIIPFDAGTDWIASQKVSQQSDLLASGTLDARNLYTFNLDASGYDKKKNFDYTSLSSIEKLYFHNKCSTPGGFSQCSSMSSARKAEADKEENLINFIRGFNTADVFTDITPYGYLDIYRPNRHNRLGDTVNATPVYVRLPQYTFNYATGGQLYNDFKTSKSSREGALYIAANDGFLHAFDGDNGEELWAYSPRIVMPNLYKLADEDYNMNHQFYVDGSPSVMDVYDSTSTTWKTILVGGLNHGGKGYYALDITNPSSPQALWEICSDTINCKSSMRIADLGYSYGNPIITRLPAGNTNAGKWVVLITSGYNNATGLGKMFVLDAINGTLLDTYNTNVGTPTTPSGLSKVSTLAPNFYYDGYSIVAYSGDLLGNIWRFDLTKPGSDGDAVKLVGTTKDSSNVAQPITSKIEIGSVPSTTDKPILYVGTGKYLGVSDLTDTQEQSLYAIKDPYTPGNSLTAISDLRTLVEQTIEDVSDVRTISSPQTVNWTTDDGWFVDFPDEGERINLDPQLNLGTLLVATNVPTSLDACTVGGYSYLYQFDYSNGAYLATATANTVAKKNANALLVGNVVVKLPSGVLKVITTSATGAKTVDALFTGGSSASGTRISWRELSI